MLYIFKGPKYKPDNYNCSRCGDFSGSPVVKIIADAMN